LWAASEEFHLVGSVVTKEGIYASESIGDH
jgi:hypothetical protein